jgi:D-alanyl-D-alanine carboxypeptidase
MNVRRVLAAGTAATVLAVAVTGGAASAAAPAPDRSTAVVLRSGLDDLHNLGITGAAGMVRDGDRVVRARSGVSDVDSGRPMPTDGNFRIGSDTKTFVAVVLLQLVGEGRIGLDDPIERWLPGVVDGNGNDGRLITVRQVLQHTSGIYNYTNDLAVLQSQDGYLAHRYDHYTEAELVAIAMRHAPLFAPGTAWSYSNTDYVVAGMLVAAVTGHPWATEVRSRILVPLGLRHTGYPADRPTLPQPHAEAYQQFGPGLLVDVTDVNATVADAAGGMVSTTSDLARFWQALQRGQLLRPQQMAQLHETVLATQFQSLRPGVAYGLGIMFIPNRCGGYWAHWGGVPGTSTLDGVTPDGRRAVVWYETTTLGDPVASQAVTARDISLLDDLICG